MVLATNVAESSVTVPDVGAVVDFAMHRTNKYDDEAKNAGADGHTQLFPGRSCQSVLFLYFFVVQPVEWMSHES